MGSRESEAVRKVLASANLQFYCEYYSISIDEIKTKPQIAIYILDHQSSLEQMIAGYSEMQLINQNICDEFQRCEQECQLLMHQMMEK